MSLGLTTINLIENLCLVSLGARLGWVFWVSFWLMDWSDSTEFSVMVILMGSLGGFFLLASPAWLAVLVIMAEPPLGCKEATPGLDLVDLFC